MTLRICKLILKLLKCLTYLQFSARFATWMQIKKKLKLTNSNVTLNFMISLLLFPVSSFIVLFVCQIFFAILFVRLKIKIINTKTIDQQQTKKKNGFD